MLACQVNNVGLALVCSSHRVFSNPDSNCLPNVVSVDCLPFSESRKSAHGGAPSEDAAHFGNGAINGVKGSHALIKSNLVACVLLVDILAQHDHGAS